MKMDKGTLLGHLSLTVVMIIFGLSFIAIKIALKDVQPFTIALIRFMIASCFLFLLIRMKHRTTTGDRSLPWVKLALMGLSGVTGFFVLQNLGLVFTTASNASLILASIPAITAILALIILGEKITASKALGIGLAILGVALIVISGDSSLRFSKSFIGEILILGSAFGWAIYTITSRSINIKVPHMIITAYSTFLGTLFLVPFSIYEYAKYGIKSISLESWGALIFLGLFASGTAFLLYNYALTNLEAGKAAIYVNLSPLVTIIAGNYYLGEQLGLMELMGGFLILSGIFISGWKRNGVASKAC